MQEKLAWSNVKNITFEQIDVITESNDMVALDSKLFIRIVNAITKVPLSEIKDELYDGIRGAKSDIELNAFLNEYLEVMNNFMDVTKYVYDKEHELDNAAYVAAEHS